MEQTTEQTEQAMQQTTEQTVEQATQKNEEQSTEFKELNKAEKQTTEAKPKVVAKDLYDKTASELALAKRKLKEKMTADELAADEAEAVLAKLAEYERKDKTNTIVIKLAENQVVGGTKIAEMLVDGLYVEAVDMLCKSQNSTIMDLKKQIKTLELAKTGIAGNPAAGEMEQKSYTLTEAMALISKSPENTQEIIKNIKK